jgi:hypothetical protein
MNTEAIKFFAKAELKSYKSALKAHFPNAEFKAESLGIAPNGKPAWKITGYGEVRLSAMEALEAQMAFSYAFFATQAKSYKLI